MSWFFLHLSGKLMLIFLLLLFFFCFLFILFYFFLCVLLTLLCYLTFSGLKKRNRKVISTEVVKRSLLYFLHKKMWTFAGPIREIAANPRHRLKNWNKNFVEAINSYILVIQLIWLGRLIRLIPSSWVRAGCIAYTWIQRLRNRFGNLI